MFDSVASWLWAHPVAFVMLVLGVEKLVLGVANWATYPKSAKEWARIRREEPRRAALVLFLRGYGFYPAKVVLGLRGIVRGVLPVPVREAVLVATAEDKPDSDANNADANSANKASAKDGGAS